MHSGTKRIIHPLTFPIIGAMVGYVAFSGYWPFIAFSLLLFPLMQMTESRSDSFWLCLAYYLSATRGLPQGIVTYTESGLWLGILLWGVGCTLNAACHAALWNKDFHKKAVYFMLSLILLAIPPLGITGWASPFTATGVLFPNLGFWGFLGFFAMWIFFVKRQWIGLAILFLSAVDVNMIASRHKMPEDSWIGAQSYAGDFDQNRAEDNQKKLVQIAKDAKGNVLLPESALTGSTSVVTLADLWAVSKSTGHTIAFGTEREEENGERRQIMVFLRGSEYQVYAQRQPVPLTMWKPYFSESYQSGWFENPIVTVGTETYAPLLCYESFLVWPLLHSAAYSPSHILVSSNLWWAQGSSIAKIQGSIVHVWARLFRIPYTVAVNHD